MINIYKQNEPKSLESHRNTPGATYDNAPSGMKSDIAQNVCQEQGFICCYCMQPISPETVKVEHKLSQAKHPKRDLDYSNMAGACKCTTGLPLCKQYCDNFKRDMDFTFDLADIEDKIQYEPTGKIKSNIPDLNDQINNVLNLNRPYLVDSRAKIWEAVCDFLKKHHSKGEIGAEISRLRQGRNGHKDRLCGVRLFFLQKRYDRMH